MAAICEGLCDNVGMSSAVRAADAEQVLATYGVVNPAPRRTCSAKGAWSFKEVSLLQIRFVCIHLLLMHTRSDFFNQCGGNFGMCCVGFIIFGR